jgi:NADPH-dependent ferric siderophore reductase
MEAGERCLKLVAEGGDDTALAYVKLSLAEHLLHIAAAEKPRIVWLGHGTAGTPLPYFREMTVVAARQVTPRMRRLTLKGENLGRFAKGGHHVRLLLPKDRAASPVWPVTGEDGRPAWPRGAERPDVRIYTIRRIDVASGEADIDFVLHGGEAHPGARFALGAMPGDRIGVTGPGGGATPEADWLLLAGDETALPAIGRMVEALPARVRAVVRIEIADAGEEQALQSAADVDLRWLHRNGAEAGTTTLLEDAVRAVGWPQACRRFAWVGCEHKSFRSIRSWLRTQQKLTRDEHLAVAYWRRGFDADDERKHDD